MTADKTIEKVDFTDTTPDTEYYNCTFKACCFAKAELQQTSFDQCVFDTCDLSLCKFDNSLRDIHFKACKMVGADFTELNKFSNGLIFENCCLNYACFAAIKLRKTIFRNCSINEADFVRADLQLSVFDRCDLSRSSFHETNLEKVDFSTASNFSFDPSTCKIKHAVFSETDLRGLLAHLNIIIKPAGEV